MNDRWFRKILKFLHKSYSVSSTTQPCIQKNRKKVFRVAKLTQRLTNTTKTSRKKINSCRFFPVLVDYWQNFIRPAEYRNLPHSVCAKVTSYPPVLKKSVFSKPVFAIFKPTRDIHAEITQARRRLQRNAPDSAIGLRSPTRPAAPRQRRGYRWVCPSAHRLPWRATMRQSGPGRPAQ